MTENAEVTPEQRQAVREKYGTPGSESKNSSLSALGLISAAGFVLAIIGMIVLATTGSIIVATIWGSLITAGVTAGFFALVAYLAVKALITSRQQ